MFHDDHTVRECNVRILLGATASRPPGHRRTWTVEVGSWRADGPTEKVAAGALSERLRVFLTQYEEPRVLSFRGHTAVVSLALGDDHRAATWLQRIVSPDGHTALTSFGAANWDEAEACARHDLVHRCTDWHDDDSVHEAAASLHRSAQLADGRYGPDELYRYAGWQRAARAAIKAGREDWHEWATEHARSFMIPRVAEPAG